MMKILCHQHYAFISPDHRRPSPLSPFQPPHKNIVKVLLNILSMMPFRSFQLSVKWGERERKLNLLNN